MTVGQTLFSHLVLDAGPLFQAANTLPATVSENFYTVPEVIAEVKDEASRAGLSRLPYEVKVKAPTPEAVKLVTEFAKATGDYATLSATDLKVIALTVSLELEHNAEASRMQKTPRNSRIHESQSTQVVGAKKTAAPRRKKGGQEVISFDDGPQEQSPEVEGEPEVDDDSDAGEWITPDNIHKYKGTSDNSWQSSTVARPKDDSSVVAVKETIPSVRVACVSSDFAVQNVLLQMRLKLYSPEGFRIKRLKNWLLRCHACYATTKQMDRKFCPKCGGPTLLRTSYSIDVQGQMTLYLRADFQYNNRGTQYSIPMPKSGRNANNLMLREDQAEYERAMKSWNRTQKKAAKGVTMDAIDDRLSAIFSGMTVRSDGNLKAYFEGEAPPSIGYGRVNPNQVRRTKN